MANDERDGGLAFPFVSQGGIHEHQVFAPGMSLLDWFAGQALAGFLAGYPIGAWMDASNEEEDPSAFESATARRWSEFAYQIAAAMLTERRRRAEESPDA